MKNQKSEIYPYEGRPPQDTFKS